MSYIITGANSGLGFETAVQLAALKNIDNADHKVEQVIITTRSQEKADKAIDKLVEKTQRPREFFSSLVFDTNDADACRAAAEAAPANVNGVVLNAGGWGTGQVLPTGVIHAFGMNVLGHAIFVEVLIDRNKLVQGGHVVFVGSFAALGTPFVPRPELKDVTDSKEWASYMDGTGYEKFDQGTCYGYTKLIGALYMGKLAHEYPQRRFYSVSPGACTNTNGVSAVNGIMKHIIPITLRIMSWFGKAHSVSDGARRLVRGVSGQDFAFENGAFVGSIKGMTGPVGDLALTRWDVFANDQAQDAVTEALRSFMK
jgi:NAD(P)-dependent dehydrogenase (short-subunit alcohol dehydrogenase family)